MNSNDETLMNAIKSDDISLVRSMIADGSANVNATLTMRVAERSALMLAAQLGRVEIVALLLDAGARIDYVDRTRNSACHVAVNERRIEVVELLVARNANLWLRNVLGQMPITIAIDSRNEQLLMLLIDAAMHDGTDDTRLLDDSTICCAAAVSTNVIQQLMYKHRIDLSAIRDINGQTPLHVAVLCDSATDVIDMLIEVAGVNLDARDERGYTAAIYACMYPAMGRLARFIAAGANVDLANNDGATPLHFSMNDLSEQTLLLLLAAGANVHAKNNIGCTACHSASIVTLPALLAFGSNFDEPDNNGVTPRQRLQYVPPTEEIAMARGRVLAVRLSFVRKRAFEVCIALHLIGLDALCMCEILQRSCGAVAPFVPFHIWWQFATLVKHHHSQNR
jgi:ankyrin repeat protein